MARLICASNTSLDGWTEDEHGASDWAPPDDEVFASITELMGSVGTYLYGRRMYETLAVWETDPVPAAQSPAMADYAPAWPAADKVVYSSTLAAPATVNTRLERPFDPGTVQELKGAADSDLLVGGPNLAGQALAAGLVDEIQLFVWPAVLGGRTPALAGGTRAGWRSSTTTASATGPFGSGTKCSGRSPIGDPPPAHCAAARWSPLPGGRVVGAVEDVEVRGGPLPAPSMGAHRHQSLDARRSRRILTWQQGQGEGRIDRTATALSCCPLWRLPPRAAWRCAFVRRPAGACPTPLRTGLLRSAP